VSSALKNLQVHARRDEVNLMPDIIECVSHDATVGEICDALRAVFGEAKSPTL
jgi:methylmalonyl-CoA mutase N-terminal domain/subunit